MLHIDPQPKPSLKQSPLTRNARRIFAVVLGLYLLLDVSERVTEIRFDSWIYIVIFMLFTFSIALMGIAELEKSIDKRINN